MISNADLVRNGFINSAGGLASAAEAERRILSIGEELLPPRVAAVVRGSAPTAEYWMWLATQLGR